jgi:methylmalonyl-CoA mutase C-terminal domain/subunit
MPLLTRLMDLIAANELADVRIFLGVIIPDEVVSRLKEMGVAAVFGPGASLEDITAAFRNAIDQRRATSGATLEDL